MEEARDGELDVRQRDEVVRAEEDIELGRVQTLDRLVVDGEVEDGKEVLRVLVDLRPLPLREHVLDVERRASRSAQPARSRSPGLAGRDGPTSARAAESSSGWRSASAAGTAPEPGRVRRMRGRLGIGTERVLEDGHGGDSSRWAPTASTTASGAGAGGRCDARGAADVLGQAALEQERCAPASRHTPAAASQRPVGETARSAAPAGGPTVKPTCQESAETAMYRPIILWSRGRRRAAAGPRRAGTRRRRRARPRRRAPRMPRHPKATVRSPARAATTQRSPRRPAP